MDLWAREVVQLDTNFTVSKLCRKRVLWYAILNVTPSPNSITLSLSIHVLWRLGESKKGIYTLSHTCKPTCMRPCLVSFFLISYHPPFFQISFKLSLLGVICPCELMLIIFVAFSSYSVSLETSVAKAQHMLLLNTYE